MDINRSNFLRQFLAVFTVFFAIFTALVSFFYFLVCTTVKEQLGNRCLGIAVATAVLFEQDSAAFKEYISKLREGNFDYEHDEYYRKMKQAMEQIRFGGNNGMLPNLYGSIAFLYIEMRKDSDEMIYVFDGDIVDTPGYSPPGTCDPLTETRRAIYDSGKSVIGKFVTTQWGTLLSAYVPIRDADGTLLAIVGADVSIEQYNDIIKVLRYVIVVSISTLLLLLAAVFYLSRKYVVKDEYLDPLTQTYKVKYFERLLVYYLRGAQKMHVPVAVCMLSIDELQQFKETRGEKASDAALGLVANILFDTTRKHFDCISYYGSGRFVVCLADISHKAMTAAIDRMLAKIQLQSFCNEEQEWYTLFAKISVGTALISSVQKSAVVIEKAQSALEQSRQTGKPEFAVWT